MTAALAVFPAYAELSCPPVVVPDDLTLVALDSAGLLSGLFARRAAVLWGVPQAAGRAVRVAAELMARAVETTGMTGPRQRLTDVGRVPPPFLGIRICLLKHAVLVEVWDSDPVSPLPVDDSGLDRHLMAVSEVSRRWNWYRPNGGGKVIWAEIATLEQPHGLPRRVAGRTVFPAPDKPVSPQNDLAVLGAVLDGLRRLDVEGSPGRGGSDLARGAAP